MDSKKELRNMSDQDGNKLINALCSNESLCIQFGTAENIDDIIEAGNDVGVEISADDAQIILEEINQKREQYENGELSEEDLEYVSGGSIAAAIAAACKGALFFGAAGLVACIGIAAVLIILHKMGKK